LPASKHAANPVTLYTIGHSTLPLDDFLSVLHAHGIETLVDIRAFPASRRFPHFSKDSLTAALSPKGINYTWMPSLGGHRSKSLDDSPNIALRSRAFRNYADYMLSPAFERAARELVSIAATSRTAYMCAERDYRQCHRRLLSDWLSAQEYDVRHITDSSPTHEHEMTPDVRLEGDQLIYRGDRLF